MQVGFYMYFVILLGFLQIEKFPGFSPFHVSHVVRLRAKGFVNNTDNAPSSSHDSPPQRHVHDEKMPDQLRI